MLASVLTASGTVELQAETPAGEAHARIGLVLAGAQVWLNPPNARALVGLLQYALQLEESTRREERTK